MLLWFLGTKITQMGMGEMLVAEAVALDSMSLPCADVQTDPGSRKRMPGRAYAADARRRGLRISASVLVQIS